MTTLIRLYFVAPLGYYFFNKIIKSSKHIYLLLIIFIVSGFSARCFMRHYITSTGRGTWSANVYIPFYFNLDLFFSGMLLSCAKKHMFARVKKIRYSVLLALFVLLTINSYIYYTSSFEGKNYMDLYMYVFPSIYIIVCALYIYNFDIVKNFRSTALTFKELKKNPMRIFDYFPKIQFPIYLFHTTVLLQLANAYNKDFYENLCLVLRISSDKYNCVIGCIYTLMSLLISIFWAIAIYKFSINKKRS